MNLFFCAERELRAVLKIRCMIYRGKVLTVEIEDHHSHLVAALNGYGAFSAKAGIVPVNRSGPTLNLYELNAAFPVTENIRIMFYLHNSTRVKYFR